MAQKPSFSSKSFTTFSVVPEWEVLHLYFCAELIFISNMLHIDKLTSCRKVRLAAVWPRRGLSRNTTRKLVSAVQSANLLITNFDRKRLSLFLWWSLISAFFSEPLAVLQMQKSPGKPRDLVSADDLAQKLYIVIVAMLPESLSQCQTADDQNTLPSTLKPSPTSTSSSL